MSDTVTWSTIHLGNFADMDRNEGTFAQEDTSALLTTFGAEPGNALSGRIVDVRSYDGASDEHDGDHDDDHDHHDDDDDDDDDDSEHGDSDHGDNIVQTDNFATPDHVEYDLGAGPVSAQVDSIAVLQGTVTFHDGSTYEGPLGTFQADNGDVFLMVLDSQPQLASQGIDTITFTSVMETRYGGLYQDNKDDHEFVCFAPGTRIATALGPRRIDKLRVGDHVITLDDGPQPIRWIGKRRLRFDVPGPDQPVRIAPGALGPGLPRRALLLSPNHRVLLSTTPAHALHDPLGALAPAKALTRQCGIRQAKGRRAITYFSLLLPMHAVLIAEGIAAESLYPGPQSWRAISGPERSAWLRLAADARVTGVPPARLLLSAAEARAGLEAGTMALPEAAPRALPWSSRRRRARPLPVHLAAG